MLYCTEVRNGVIRSRCLCVTKPYSGTARTSVQHELDQLRYGTESTERRNKRSIGRLQIASSLPEAIRNIRSWNQSVNGQTPTAVSVSYSRPRLIRFPESSNLTQGGVSSKNERTTRRQIAKIKTSVALPSPPDLVPSLFLRAASSHGSPLPSIPVGMVNKPSWDPRSKVLHDTQKTKS